MGWTSFPMHRPVKEWYKEQLPDNYTAIDIAVVKRMTLYAAVKNLKTGETYCEVLMIRWSRSYYNFSYKPMSEFSGPGMSDCPLRILKHLSPLNDTNDPHGWAREWRKRVVQYHETRKKMSTGTVMLLDPVEFTNGTKFQFFRKIGRRLWAGLMQDDKFYPICRVRINLDYYEYKIV